MNIKSTFQKSILNFLIVIILAGNLFYLSGCSDKTTDAEKGITGTQFVKYAYGVNTGETDIDFLFYTTKSDLSIWNMDKITDAYLKIDTHQIPVEVTDITISESPYYDYFYSGNLAICGELDACSGEASLIIYTEDSMDSYEYSLGEMVISEETMNDAVIENLITSGLVATDKEDNDKVKNYGIIIHLNTKEDITIKNVSFGFPDINTNLDKAVVYLPDEYQNKISSLIENGELNQEIKDCYTKEYSDDLNRTYSLPLKAGESYIYVPIVQTDASALEVATGAIHISYEDGNGDEKYYVSPSSPYFSEFSKTKAELYKMFSVEP